ncbi:unnamed protein product [Phytophthora fragariaefolia]|uniref:Unnamed protein product n=1 Tax=Phytophthora fragariaefolia TaxID=1490495 RepID=A0A9W6XFS7_9STRA|nr:unnamed protein product [Phytophthora fragariaefolia]
MICKIAKNNGANVYECLARPSSRSKTIVENLFNANDDVTNRVPIKLLFYIGMPVMITRKPNLLEADFIANGVIGSIVGMHPLPADLASTAYSVNGAIINRFEKYPDLLLIKIHVCLKGLVTGLFEGVIGVPPLHVKLQLKQIPNLAQTCATVDQFAIVPAFACTTEKLQRRTCYDGVVVTPLNRRKGSPKQTFLCCLVKGNILIGSYANGKSYAGVLIKFCT